MTIGRALPVGAMALATVLVMAGLFVAGLRGGPDAFEQTAGFVAVAGVALIAATVRPAWPLSIGLALGVFSGHWADIGLPLPLDRPLIAVAVLSALVRERRARPDALRTLPIDWLLIVTALYAICSGLLAGTLDDADTRFVLLDRFALLGFLLFFVAPMVYRTARDRQILLGTLVALGAYLGATALVETTGPRGLLLPRYIDDPAVGIHFDRARGPFTESVANGLVLYACAVAAAVAAVSWQDRRAKGLAGVIAALCLLGTLFTVTRAIWLAVAVATVVTLLAGRRTRRWAIPLAGAGAVMVLVAFAVVPGLAGRADERTNDDRPVWDRRNSNAAALRMVAERPLVGFGMGTFRTESVDYYRQGPDFPLTFVRDLHNVYLAHAVELGFIGAGLWLLALTWAVGGGVLGRGPPALRPWKLGLVAVAISYAVAAATTPLAFALPTLLLWTWAGVAWSGRRAEAAGA